ncbi:lipopolysaccharide biosynthesis protein [Ferribacterium limneticum]|uniref:lipopolysaccharide biosynthesis protein n=1 Tax=Ferribacterium limneticum TaxID=76259 RepID=UPI001CF88FD1|nr:lipopolysaccharide biosynthesis protein [Ferribacterium limneticum]UCV24219.1 lipopolysaccharide biosynthesis protein [Ferribacterium limneticum]
MSLANSTVRGVIWNFSDMLLRRGLVAATTLVLSYFLSPADFGLVAMMSVFLVVLGGLMDSGLKEALIRRKRLSIRLLNTTLWASLWLGCLAYALLFCVAPWAALFYNEPSLVNLLRIAGLVIIFNALQTAPAARLTQALDFRALMRISLPASGFSCLLALLLAYLGAGVWALIVQTLAAAAMSTILTWKVAGWRPRLQVDFKPLVALFRFGYKLFLSNLVALTVRNAAPSMLGKFLGPTYAGYYYFVDKIMEMIMGQLVYSVQNVTYPSFSKISRETVRLREAYRKAIEIMVFLVSPLLMIGAGLAEPLFEVFFSPRWLPAAGSFMWLCFAYLLYPMHAINLNIIKVVGRSDIFLWLELLKAAIALSVLWITLPWGMEAVLLGQVCTSLICFLPNAMYSKPLIGYSAFDQIKDVFLYYACAAIGGGVAHVIANSLVGYAAILIVMISGVVGVLAYLLSCRVLKLRAWQLISIAFGNFTKRQA